MPTSTKVVTSERVSDVTGGFRINMSNPSIHSDADRLFSAHSVKRTTGFVAVEFGTSLVCPKMANEKGSGTFELTTETRLLSNFRFMVKPDGKETTFEMFDNSTKMSTSAQKIAYFSLRDLQF
ncbi:hypothetical protein NEOLI_002333 [Neolecta irregularis DAH-3]|uniref:Uncharacterized protein n=1 Tax=Neolecta irregularis (strain DAH-3) TaxID=1198029 RepID=A0A1U7LUZ5_NEOID|nr:hypothetical protein NEOLI_002333 [Neolecta irregularis DAH-3]|eukprot:OLL26496.1 hypothetical protein NEOLI_002333 [Neolecta irregularis DAH-3]